MYRAANLGLKSVGSALRASRCMRHGCAEPLLALCSSVLSSNRSLADRIDYG